MVDMVTTYPLPASERTAEAMLQMILDYGHIDEDGVLSVQLKAWQIDLLCSYGSPDADLEDGDDEDEAVL